MIYTISRFLIPRYITTRVLSNINYFSTTQDIIVKDAGVKAVVLLNRPKQLNALSASQNENLYSVLKSIEKHKSLVIIKGAGDKALSTGGDLKELEKANSNKNLYYIIRFNLFLNATLHLLYSYRIPVITFINGVVFGAGSGLLHCSKYSIATDTSKFTMPEVRIGTIPNGGSSYFLTRKKGYLGYYLALTAHTLKGTDIHHAGLSTHFCHSKNLDQLEAKLLRCHNNDNIENILEDVCVKSIPKFSLDEVLDKIDKCFSQPTVEMIITELKKDGSKWAKETLQVMERCSPTTLKVILKQLQKGKDLNFTNCLIMEDILTKLFIEGPDGSEGVRVTLYDRNDTPKWNPSDLSQVSNEEIDKYFEEYKFSYTDLQNGIFGQRFL